jgi:hypothetical protein
VSCVELAVDDAKAVVEMAIREARAARPDVGPAHASSGWRRCTLDPSGDDGPEVCPGLTWIDVAAFPHF